MINYFLKAFESSQQTIFSHELSFMKIILETFVSIVKNAFTKLPSLIISPYEFDSFLRSFCRIAIREQHYYQKHEKPQNMEFKDMFFPVIDDIFLLIPSLTSSTSYKNTYLLWTHTFNLITAIVFPDIQSLYSSSQKDTNKTSQLNQSPVTFDTQFFDPSNNSSLAHAPTKLSQFEFKLFENEDIFSLENIDPSPNPCFNISLLSQAIRTIQKLFLNSCPHQISVKIFPKMSYILTSLMLLNKNYSGFSDVSNSATLAFVAIVKHIFENQQKNLEQQQEDFVFLRKKVASTLENCLFSTSKLTKISQMEQQIDQQNIELFSLFDFLLPNFLDSDPTVQSNLLNLLSRGVSILISDTFTPQNVPSTQRNLAKHCLQLIVHWIQELSKAKNKNEKQTNAETFLILTFLEISALLLTKFSETEKNNPNIKITIDHPVSILEYLRDLSLDPFSLKIIRDKSKQLGQEFPSFSSLLLSNKIKLDFKYEGEAFHLYSLFPVFCECLNTKFIRIRELLQQIFFRISKKL
ncbi:hypothetical protein M0811_09187 [Anaeramoeba ignava]|uniref:Uncharacterized protein n=1 Tax=Anaeramoeba ignava TaxID=1746090 RepID=A0A9Q0RAY8_ANAIG|nr:hypothetical protein M0811_09187 [Anaeramoeba ignava]